MYAPCVKDGEADASLRFKFCDAFNQVKDLRNKQQSLLHE